MENFYEYLNGFTIIFMSIILEAIPFVLIGAIVSSLIQLFISEKTIRKLLPKSKIKALVGAALLGIIFPVCECAIVPIMRRLVKKGVPLDVAITFMLAVPIFNPIVLLSTYYAFSNQPQMVIYRGLLGVIGAITIGFIIGRFNNKDVFKKGVLAENQACCNHDHGHDHEHDHEHHRSHKKRNRFVEIIDHTSSEFFDVGRFLIIGAFLSSIMQTFVPREMILSIGRGQISSIIVLMIMAFALSLCSEADAFIARTFVGQFTQGSIIGFLIFGPMLDIKNTIMLSATFKTKFVVKLAIVISLVCFSLALLFNIFIK